MTNVTNNEVVDNRSSFIGQANYWGFCATGTGSWTVALQYSDASSSGPWITPGGSASVSNYSSTCIGSYLGYHNFFTWAVTGSAVVRYSAVRDFWMPQGGGQVTTGPPAVPYVTNASPSPMSIPEINHGQGYNVSADCWSGPLTVDFHLTGNKVLCLAANDGMGNLTITYADNVVGSVMVSASGPGPPGPSGLGAQPFAIAAGVSPMSIPSSTHGEGIEPLIECWSGPLILGKISGTRTLCQSYNDGAGNLTVTWSDNVVGSILIQTSGRPAPYAMNVTTSPMTIPVATHGQGYAPVAHCYSAAVVAGVATGFEVLCGQAKDSTGNIIVYFGPAVQSVQIQ